VSVVGLCPGRPRVGAAQGRHGGPAAARSTRGGAGRPV